MVEHWASNCEKMDLNPGHGGLPVYELKTKKKLYYGVELYMLRHH